MVFHRYGALIINYIARIGDNVNLSQFTTIGACEGEGTIIDNNVYIGSNVCLVENVTIGAASIAVKSIPDNATAVGNYARVLNYDRLARYIQNR